MRRRVLARWSAGALVLVASASCGGGEDRVERLAEDLVAETDGALDDDEATCVATRLDDAFGDDAFGQVLDAANGRGEDPDGVRTEVIDIFADCDALGAVMLDP